MKFPNPILEIQEKKIGSCYPSYFIADIAANHDGDLSRAIDLIRLAAESGADAVKFQHFAAETIVRDHCIIQKLNFASILMLTFSDFLWFPRFDTNKLLFDNLSLSPDSPVKGGRGMFSPTLQQSSPSFSGLI